jgi:general secretion pathway protein G
MTLIEIIFVVALIAVVMGVVASNLGERADKAKANATRVEIQNVVNTLDLYKLEVGRYPTQSEGLQALITAPQGAARWNGPYWKKKEIPTDAWGTEFRYIVPGKNGAPFEVISLGADGQDGGEGVNREISSTDPI